MIEYDDYSEDGDLLMSSVSGEMYLIDGSGRLVPLSHLRDNSRWVDPRRTTTKEESPYGYSEFFHFGNRDIIMKASGADYSDRLWQWNRPKMEACQKELGKRWELASKAELSKMISAYYDKPMQVIALAEGCNISNGYPYYILWYA